MLKKTISTGKIYKSTGRFYYVKLTNSEFIKASIAGRLRRQIITSTNPLAVGDNVRLEQPVNSDKSTFTIFEILPRKNYLVRKSVNLSKHKHIIAANVDQLILIVTLKNPTTTTTFIDRILATSVAFSINPIIVFNKVDLYNAEELKGLDDLIAVYSKIGYVCLQTSVKENKNIGKILNRLKTGTTIFIGHSGSGKSSIINKIHPQLDLKMKTISEKHFQGMHTTTFSEMYDLPSGGMLIDSPGIKGFGIVKIQKNELSNYFMEFFKYSHFCKYNNCYHINEPHCMVLKKLAEGVIARSRYKSYLQIIEDDDEAKFR